MNPKKKKIRLLRLLIKLTLITIFALYALGGILNMRSEIATRQGEVETLRSETQAQAIRNAALMEDLESEDHTARIAREARDRLGLVQPGEIIIVDVTP